MSDGPSIGRYIVERRIASGGMADVYLARQVGSYGFAKHVALKVLKREIATDDEHVKMFIREALVAAEFRHPNLAQVYEVGDHDGQLFIAMELVRGVSVTAMLRGLGEREKGMALNVAVRIAMDTLDGLAHAHELVGPDKKPLGLVHRDISPQNIMVGVDGAVKVVDFGIARVETAFGKTIAPKIKGKFCYMAPEQWEPRGGLDARADVFALGIVLYEMTTGGTRLFRGESPKEVYKAITIDPIPDPRTRVPEYPEALARIVMRALERGPNARWPSARAMRAALVNFSDGEGWSMTQRAVADTVRAALGPGEIESRWEPVAADGPRATSGDDDGDGPTSVEKSASGSSGLSGGATVIPPISEVPQPPPSMGAALGTITALLALAFGAVGGYAIGRRSSRAGQTAAANAGLATSSLSTRVASVPPTPLRVRASDVLAGEPVASAVRAAWQRVHPEIDLRLESARPTEAFGAVLASNADVAIAMRAPSASEVANAAASGVDIGASAQFVVAHVTARVVVHPSNALASIGEARVRDIFAGHVAAWDGAAASLGPVRPVLRRSTDELLARVNESLLQGAAPPPGVENVETEAAARALAASDPHAITVLGSGALEHPGGAVRAIDVVPAVAGERFLGYPLTAVTRGPARGPARTFLDWLRASDVAPSLRDANIVAD